MRFCRGLGPFCKSRLCEALGKIPDPAAGLGSPSIGQVQVIWMVIRYALQGPAATAQHSGQQNLHSLVACGSLESSTARMIAQLLVLRGNFEFPYGSSSSSSNIGKTLTAARAFASVTPAAMSMAAPLPARGTNSDIVMLCATEHSVWHHTCHPRSQLPCLQASPCNAPSVTITTHQLPSEPPARGALAPTWDAQGPLPPP